MKKRIEMLSERFGKDSLMALATVDDPNTVILRLRLCDGTLFSNGAKYEF